MSNQLDDVFLKRYLKAPAVEWDGGLIYDEYSDEYFEDFDDMREHYEDGDVSKAMPRPTFEKFFSPPCLECLFEDVETPYDFELDASTKVKKLYAAFVKEAKKISLGIHADYNNRLQWDTGITE